MSDNQEFEQLRNAIETAVGRKMESPRDFNFLAQAIFEKTHQSISTSTLKRFWNYLPQYATIRISTLNLLSQFIDYKDWEDFCQAHEPISIPPETSSPAPTYLGGGNKFLNIKHL